MFKLNTRQHALLKEWQKDKPESNATMGEQYEYCFTPTGVGTLCVVKCLITKTQIDLTDYDNW